MVVAPIRALGRSLRAGTVGMGQERWEGVKCHLCCHISFSQLSQFPSIFSKAFSPRSTWVAKLTHPLISLCVVRVALPHKAPEGSHQFWKLWQNPCPHRISGEGKSLQLPKTTSDTLFFAQGDLTNLVHGSHCSKYRLTRIPGTNAFVGIVNETCDSLAFCACSMVDRLCLNCHR